MPSATRYLRVWCLATIALLFAVGLFNLLVDPYGLFRIVSVEGFNRVKSQAGQRPEVFKRRAVEIVHPTTLILGNSRAEIGFDPESPSWPSDARPVFNFAIPGTGPNSALDQLTYALRVATPRLVLVPLDFLDFRVEADPVVSPPPLRTGALSRLREYASALLTISALADSFTTIYAQHKAYHTSLTDAGFNPMNDYAGIALREGYYAMFRQRDEENAKGYVKGSKTIRQTGGDVATEFLAVDEIMALAARNGMAIRFVIYPYHAHILELFHQAGLWPAFEDWKRELVRRVDSAPVGTDVELWDFSGFSPYAVEPVPMPGDTRAEMRWYWEAGHFKKALGDIILERIFEAGDSQTRWGRRLNGRNVETHLLRQRAERDAYELSLTGESADLAKLVAAARSGR